MERKQSKAMILFLLIAAILFCSSYISVNSFCFQTVSQDTFCASISQEEKILNSNTQQFTQMIMEDGIRTLSSFTCVLRNILNEKKTQDVSIYSMFADGLKSAATMAFLMVDSIYQKEWESVSSKKRILDFIHCIDGKK